MAGTVKSGETGVPAGQDRSLFIARLTSWIMPVVAVLLVLEGLIGAGIAHGWPLVHDAPLIHYVVFLMDHGRAPYRDIVEMNMPGTYMAEWLGMHVLGGGAPGWWLWDVLAGIAAVSASAWIAGTGRRAAGVAGGMTAYLLHLRGGPANLGQRDWIVAVLLLVAFGFLFRCIRSGRASWMAGFMGFCGMAASIKPPVLGVGVCFLVAACWVLRRERRGGALVGWALLGGVAAALPVAIFLLRWGVTRDFLVILHGLVPWYAGLQRLSLGQLLGKASVLGLLLAGTAAWYVSGRSWRRWESNFLGAAVLAGMVLYLIQGKGWSYHRYPAMVFVTLWGLLEIGRALKGDGPAWQVAGATLLLVVFVATPLTLMSERANVEPMETMTHLEGDLNRLGGRQLSGKVQCLDMTMGSCINVLYRLRLEQSTGFIYDFYLFPREPNGVTGPLQARFLREMREHTPQVLVLSSHTWPGDTYSYEQVDRWPAFGAMLRQNYRLESELPKQPSSAGYRLYVLAR